MIGLHLGFQNDYENTGFWVFPSPYDSKNTGFCIGSLSPCFFACFLVAKMRPGWSPHLCNKKASKNTGFWQHPDAEPCVFTVIRARKNPEACVFTVILETQVQPYHTLKGSRSLLPSLFKACGNPDATLSHFEGVEVTFA